MYRFGSCCLFHDCLTGCLSGKTEERTSANASALRLGTAVPVDHCELVPEIVSCRRFEPPLRQSVGGVAQDLSVCGRKVRSEFPTLFFGRSSRRTDS